MQAGLHCVGQVSVDDGTLVELWESSLHTSASSPVHQESLTDGWAPAWWSKAIDSWGAMKVHLDHPLWKSSRFAARLAAFSRLARTAKSPLLRKAVELEGGVLIVRTPTSSLHASG